jgi:hypothetical protein
VVDVTATGDKARIVQARNNLAAHATCEHVAHQCQDSLNVSLADCGAVAHAVVFRRGDLGQALLGAVMVGEDQAVRRDEGGRAVGEADRRGIGDIKYE